MKLKSFLKKPSNIEVKPSMIHGYGVFARKNIAAGEIIEECPVILLQESEAEPFKNYQFLWKKGEEVQYALVLGWGMLYNHADEPNAKYEPDYERRMMQFKAIKPIRRGEEIYIYYSKNWFKLRGIQLVHAKEQPGPKFSWRAVTRTVIGMAAILFLGWAAKQHG